MWCLFINVKKVRYSVKRLSFKFSLLFFHYLLEFFFLLNSSWQQCLKCNDRGENETGQSGLFDQEKDLHHKVMLIISWEWSWRWHTGSPAPAVADSALMTVGLDNLGFLQHLSQNNLQRSILGQCTVSKAMTFVWGETSWQVWVIGGGWFSAAGAVT